MFPVGLESVISAGERPQTQTLDHAATGNLVGLVEENKLIQVHGISNFINVCHSKIPMDFLCTKNTLTGILAKFNNNNNNNNNNNVQLGCHLVAVVILHVYKI